MSITKSNVNEYAELIKMYREHPLLFVKQVLKIDLTPKQTQLFLDIIKSDQRLACKSATGTGKTLTFACVVLHQLLVEIEGINILCTSPSAGQLDRGLRSEIGVRHQNMMEPFKSDYVLMKEKIYIKGKSDSHFCALVTGSAENTQSLAGVHAPKVLILIDEADTISQDIMDVLYGNLTTAGSAIAQISNPTKPSGPFYNIFANDEIGKGWVRVTLTAFDSPHISPQWIEMIEREYGADSDFYRMRVLGEFPRSASSQFISTDSVSKAVSNNCNPSIFRNFPIVLGVDVARFGDDSTVFVLRQGPKVHEVLEFKGLDTMEVVAKLSEYRNYKQPNRIYVDGGGLGAGVVDRCKELGIAVIDVVVASKSVDPKQYSNLRSQVWGSMKNWIENGGDLPNDSGLVEQLTGMVYGYNNRMQIQLMTKKDIKRKGLPSPDKADALALTFSDDVFAKARGRSAPREIIRSNTLWA